MCCVGWETDELDAILFIRSSYFSAQMGRQDVTNHGFWSIQFLELGKCCDSEPFLEADFVHPARFGTSIVRTFWSTLYPADMHMF